MKYLVLSANTFDFTSKDNRRIKGVKVSYVNLIKSIRDNDFGNPPMIVTCDKLDDEILKNLPAVCDLSFQQVTGRNNKPDLILTGAKIVKKVDFNSI